MPIGGIAKRNHTVMYAALCAGLVLVGWLAGSRQAVEAPSQPPYSQYGG